jgi:hypothetical protein
MNSEDWMLVGLLGVAAYLIFIRPSQAAAAAAPAAPAPGAFFPGGPPLPPSVSTPAGTPLVTVFPEIAVGGPVPAGYQPAYVLPGSKQQVIAQYPAG